jgi:hypothetical protein
MSVRPISTVVNTILHDKQVLAKWLDHNAAYLLPASAMTFFKVFKYGVSFFQLLT